MAIKTLVLVSQENFVWHSMQEIIPGIERSWLASARPGKHEVKVVNVEKKTFAQIIPLLMSANNIVIACYTYKLISLVKFFREKLSTDNRLFIYNHNQASIAFWPYIESGLAALLRADDVFISNCKLDAEMTRLSFKNAHIEEIPFVYELPKSLKKKSPKKLKNKNDPDFVYVGRISTQKNIHTLLYAFRIFLGIHPNYRGNLVIYGDEDHLGSPNMGMSPKKKSLEYSKSLRGWLKKWGLQKRVLFLGHRPRSEINRKLSGDVISVSAGLHSDENFGMAALAALARGNRAVLSQWGGHEGFLGHFPKLSVGVTVQGGAHGPWIDPREFAVAMQTALTARKPESPARLKSYSLQEISGRLFRLALSAPKKGDRLILTAVSQRLARAQKRYASEFSDPREAKQQTRIFHSYSDPDSHLFFQAYGMKSLRPALAASGSLLLHPWVKIDGGRVIVSDPHRGQLVLNLELSSQWRIYDGFQNQVEVSQFSAQVLLRDGYALVQDSELMRYLQTGA